MPCAYVAIVDDNPISLTIAAKLFNSLGWCVIRCRTADMLMQVYLDNDLTLILCDFILGIETAIRVVKELRNYEKESMTEDAIPIIGFSSHPKAKTDFMTAGGTDFFNKPLTKENVMTMVSLYGNR